MLVIIGLLAGSILTGRTLIEASRLLKVGTELRMFTTASATFIGKYSCLPGDCANATTFFGTDSNGCPTGGGATGVCNGNGDGTINGWHGTGNVESFYVWKHLALAGLISGSYSGTGCVNGCTINMATDTPGSSYSPLIGYNMFSPNGLVYGDPASFSVTIQIGAIASQNIGWDFYWGSGFTAPQAWELDRKIDDGMPSSGQLISQNGFSPSVYNTNTTCLSGTVYSTSNATGCLLYYNLKIQ